MISIILLMFIPSGIKIIFTFVPGITVRVQMLLHRHLKQNLHEWKMWVMINLISHI